MRVESQQISATKGGRDLPMPKVTRPYLIPRTINVAFNSITRDDLLPGELVWNVADATLVYRLDHGNIVRFLNDASRGI